MIRKLLVKSRGIPYYIYKCRTASVWAAKLATVTGSRTVSMCSNQEMSYAKSGSCHYSFRVSHHATFSITKKPFLLNQLASEIVWLHNYATFAVICIDKIHAQYPTYLSSNVRYHVIVSDVEPESNLDHWLKWIGEIFFSFLLSTGKGSHTRKTLE